MSWFSDSAWEDSSWSNVGERLERLREISVEHDFRVVVVVFPVAYQFFAGFLENSPQRTMEALAARFGFAYLDLLPVARKDRSVDFYYDQCHPRKIGNQIFGAAIAQYLVSERLLAPRGSPP